MALYKHNQEIYDQIVEAMHEGVNDFCYVQDTGTGKSFIAMELIRNDFAGKKVAYVVPKYAIEVNMRKYSDFDAVGEMVTFFTYNYFDSDEKAAAVAAEYDVVFVDEAHHLGSDIYGTCLLRLRELICENKNKYFIGTTATPLREDGKDITEFFARSFQGLTVFDAIKQELMPKIEYLTCSMNLSKDEIKKLKDANIKLDIGKSTNLLREIVTTNDKNIWIVFFSRIEDIRSNEENIRALFPNHKMVIINSKAEEPLTKLAEIRQDEKVVILTVNMLLEGLHLDGVEGILNFRNTESLTVFRQMIGRILKIGNSHSPLVVDCSQSAYVMLRKLMDMGNLGDGIGAPQSGDRKKREIVYIGVTNKKYFDIDHLVQKMRMGAAGWDISYYQKLAKDRGFECLATEYVGAKKKITWRCSKGHVWEAAASNIKRGGCPVCAGRQGRDVSFYQEIAKERGFECLATEYVGVNKKIPWRCSKGHVWQDTALAVKRRRYCPVCLGRKGRNISYYQEIAKERGFECLATEYVGTQKKIPWRCSKGHVWEANVNCIKRGNGCGVCAGKAGRDVSFYKELAKERGVECLATEYVGVNKKIPWRCSEGHVWHASMVNVRGGTSCPVCAGHAGRDVSFYQDLRDNNYGITCLAVEYVGVTKEIPWRCAKGHTWRARFNYQKRGGCPVCAGRQGRDVSFYQEIAKERGFECLATEYVGTQKKIPWRCSKGHVWEATVGNIRKGRGCPYCSGRAGRDVSFYQEIAKERGFECLATEYVGVTKNIPWRCPKGHVWETPADRVKRETECPVCMSMRK